MNYIPYSVFTLTVYFSDIILMQVSDNLLTLYSDSQKFLKSVSNNSPEERVLNFSVHEHCFEHRTLANNKLYHTVNCVQQRPVNTQ